MTVLPYTMRDFEIGEQIVMELHGVSGFDAWADRIARAIAAERERCAKILENKAELETNSLCCADDGATINSTYRWARGLKTAAGLVRGEK